MNTVHIVMAASAALLGITALIVVRRGQQLRLVLAIACTALVIGHAASLLETAPAWYSVGLVVATVAGLGWVIWHLIAARRAERAAGIRVVRMRPAHLVRPRDAHARAGRPLYAVPTAGPDIVDAEIVEDDTDENPGTNCDERSRDGAEVISIIRDHPRRHVTASEILDSGPVGGETTMGSTYVAANLSRYLGAGGPGNHRAHGRGEPECGHRTRPVRQASPEATLRAMQVRAAYGVSGHPPRRPEHDFRA